jgi:hypothetical protein
MFFNTEDTEDTEMICNRHRVYQEKPKGFSQSHAAVWSRSLCAEPLGSSCHLPILSQSEKLCDLRVLCVEKKTANLRNLKRNEGKRV